MRTPSEKALFSLLKSISLDMLDINIASDSIIAPAVTYYARHGSKSHRMKSLLYLGRTQWYAGDNEAAILSFTKAAELAKKLGDDMHVGLALSSAANTYNRNYNIEEEYNAHAEAQTIKRLKLILFGSVLIFVLGIVVVLVPKKAHRERRRRMTVENDLLELSDEAMHSRNLADEEIGNLKIQLAGLRAKAAHMHKSSSR